MKLPSRVPVISVANFADWTVERTSPLRFPSSTIDCRRSSNELMACRAFARNLGLPSSVSMAVFSRGHPPRYQPIAPVSKVPYDLFQAINRIRNLLSSFETGIHRDLPSVVEGVARELLFALKVTVDPAFLQPRRSHEIG